MGDDLFMTWDGLIEMLRKLRGDEAPRQQLASLIDRVAVFSTTRGVEAGVPEHSNIVWR